VHGGSPTAAVDALEAVHDGTPEDLPEAVPEAVPEDLLEAVPDALVGVDRAGMIRYVNRQTETLFGYDRDDLIGSSVEMLVPDSLRQVHEVQRDLYLEDPRARVMAVNLNPSGRRRNGTTFPVDIALSHVVTPAGLLVIAAVRDLTGRPEVEGRHTLLARLAAIVEESGDAIIGGTLDGTVTSWNRAAWRMYGYSEQEIIGKSITLLVPQGRTGESDAIQAMIRAGQLFENFETLRVRKDGTVFPASITVSPLRDEDGSAIGAFTITRDVTKQQAAFESAQRMAAIVTDSSDAIISSTLDGIVTSWNPAAERMFGYSSVEMIGRSISPVSPPDGEGEIKAILVKVSAGQPVEHLDSLRVRRDRTVFPVSLTVSPIRDTRGVVVGGSFIARDVTQERLAQQEIAQQRAAALVRLAELNKANADLESVNKAMQGFIDVAAHDLRTPLTSVVGYSDLLTEGWATLSEESKQKFAGSINRQAHNLAGLVNDLITLSSIEGGVNHVRPTSVPLGEAIRTCLEQLEPSAGSVSVSCPPDLAVWVDPTHLAIIIDHYVENAVRYGGPPVSIAATPGYDAIEIRVLDHGPGVPPDFVPLLFSRFAQADSWGTQGQGGTGLGLSIVQGLARVNGGQVLYEPNPAGGSCFIVRLPRTEPPADLGSLPGVTGRI